MWVTAGSDKFSNNNNKNGMQKDQWPTTAKKIIGAENCAYGIYTNMAKCG
jgi:hypothetical protein